MAIDLAREQTFTGTTIDDIARRLEVSKAAVYYHFRAKEQLLASLVGPLLDELEQLLESACQPDNQLREPRALLRAYLDVLVKHRDVVPLVVQDVSVINHPVLGGRPDDIDRRLRALLAASLNGVPAAEPRATAALAALRRPVLVLPLSDIRRHRRTLLAAATAALGLRSRKDANVGAGDPEVDAVDPGGWESEEAATFPASPLSVGAIRLYVRKVLSQFPVGEDVLDTAALVTTEMVAYVLASCDPDTDLLVRLTRNDSRFGVEVVNDDAPATAFGLVQLTVGSTDPALRPRSVALVDALAAAWGIERRLGESIRFWGEFPIRGPAQN
ncbi:MAG TPA: TetR family transcriptional regulator [Acidimicrobiales bacterium]|nr:TetR family transcriptional regulator [Acidimicrobiales bacterium]